MVIQASSGLQRLDIPCGKLKKGFELLRTPWNCSSTLVLLQKGLERLGMLLRNFGSVAQAPWRIVSDLQGRWGLCHTHKVFENHNNSISPVVELVASEQWFEAFRWAFGAANISNRKLLMCTLLC